MIGKNKEEAVVLVNGRDEELGTMGKHEAHLGGVLHRAFSIFLFDAQGRTLLQQRAATKYHSPSLWTNTCCSHPRPGEKLEQAAGRRLHEEMGLSVTLEHRFSFTYRAEVGNGLIEHELDHVLFGRTDGPPTPDPSEVQNWRYLEVDELSAELKTTPEHFTPWLHICWPLVLNQLRADPKAEVRT